MQISDSLNWKCKSCQKPVQLPIEFEGSPEELAREVESRVLYCPYCAAPVRMDETATATGEVIKKVWGGK